MSFRLFVWYCMVAGAWSGFIGWVFGYALAPEAPQGYGATILHDCIQGTILAVVIAFGLSLLDAVFNLSLRQPGKVLMRVVAGVVVGVFGGLLGSFIGGSLYYAAKNIEMATALKTAFGAISFMLGWTIVGFLIGFSICFFEFGTGLVTRKNFGGAFKKFIKCVIGGTVGGIFGGLIAYSLGTIAARLIDKSNLWSPTAYGFIAIGACIGLLVGLAQIMLKEAWIKVEAGFRPGREMLIQKEKTSIGRAEGSDIALFGDMAVEKAHANIVLEGGRYFLEDLQSPNGTYLNEQKVDGKAPLKAGDLIRIGKSILRFNERAKRKD